MNHRHARPRHEDAQPTHAAGSEALAGPTVAELLDLVSDAVASLEVAADGTLLGVTCNRSAMALYGLDANGCDLSALGDELADRFRLCAQRRTATAFEHAAAVATAGQPWLQSCITPLFDGSGRLQRLVLVSQPRDRVARDLEAEARHERDLRALVLHTPAPLIRYDRDCRRLFVNDAFCRASGIARERALGDQPCDNPFIRGAVDRYHQWLLAVMASGTSGEIEISGEDAAGNELIYRWQGVPELGLDGEVESVLVLGRDITEQRRGERERHARELLFRSLVENSPDIVSRIDRNLNRVYLNPVAMSLLSAASLGSKPSDGSFLCDPVGYERLLGKVFESAEECSWQTTYRANGTRRALLLRVMPEFDIDGTVTTVLAIGRDVHDLVQERCRAEQMALTDNLTGLANRCMLTRHLLGLQVERRAYALAILDLDHFKNINDTLGHRAGDDLLAELARRLQAVVGEQGLAARLGGDEFALLLPDCTDPAALTALAERVQDVLHQPVRLHQRALTPSVSIGLVLCAASADPDAGGDALARADLALYDAKHAGRATYRIWQPALSEQLNEAMAMEADLAGAAARGELRLHVQPLIRLHDGVLVGAEALLRWQHPRRGLVMPDVFIPVAESSGLMVELSDWVIEHTCGLAARWNRHALQPLRICMNLSARDFARAGIVARVETALRRHACRGAWIGVEITESLLLGKGDHVTADLQGLRALGINVAIDDFGTGYSALSYLQHLRIDRLKIDRSFVQKIDLDERQRALVRACIALGEALGLELVAEGVETEAQAELLRTLGCTAAQGWLYARAMPVDEFGPWCQARCGVEWHRAPADPPHAA